LGAFTSALPSWQDTGSQQSQPDYKLGLTTLLASMVLGTLAEPESQTRIKRECTAADEPTPPGSVEKSGVTAVEAAVFDKQKRIEDNETLKRALHLAETGLYQSCRDIERELMREQYPRISEVLDAAMRKRIDKICFARRTPRRQF
jgi:hypothetical protein